MASLPKELGLAIEVTLFLLLISAAYTDIMAGKVYNWCTFPAFCLGLILNFGIGGWAGRHAGEACLLSSVQGVLLGGGVFWIFYLFGWIAGGDVKLIAAVGALKGLKFAFYGILYTSIIGCIMAMGMLIWQGRLLQAFAGSFRMLFAFRRPLDAAAQEKTEAARATMPYGVAISIGCMWAWWADLLYRRLQAGH